MRKHCKGNAKRIARELDIFLRRFAVVHHSAMDDGEVRCVDIKFARVTIPTRSQAAVIADRAHPWAVFMAVMTDDYRMHPAATAMDRPMIQAEMVTTLEEEHQRLRAEAQTLIGLEGNGVQIHSYGWIATPRPHDIEPEQAERLFAAALKTVRRYAA